MADYFHSALRGEQIHQAKVKILPEGTSIPVPEWEGQILVIGKKFYYSAKQNGVLNWVQPVSYQEASIPPSVVIHEQGIGNPQNGARNDGKSSGVFYVDAITKVAWYLYQNEWIKLGGSTDSSDFLFIGGVDSSFYPLPGEFTKLTLVSWKPEEKYYFAFKAPDKNTLFSGLEGYDVTTFGGQVILENIKDGDYIEVDTSQFNAYLNSPFKPQISIGVKINIYYEYRHLCSFKVKDRLIEVTGLGTENYGG